MLARFTHSLFWLQQMIGLYLKSSMGMVNLEGIVVYSYLQQSCKAPKHSLQREREGVKTSCFTPWASSFTPLSWQLAVNT